MKRPSSRLRLVAFTTLLYVCSTLVSFGAKILSNEEKVEFAAQKVAEKAKDYQIYALELSLYYQGFSPNIVGAFDQYDEHYTPWRTYNEVPRGTDLKSHIKIRDAAKAFEYAEIAVESKDYLVLKESNLANLFLNGIGIPKDVAKAIETLNEATFPPDFKPVKIEDRGTSIPREIYAPQIAYLYYKGMGVEKDVEKCNEILEKYGVFAWRNFYSGYLVPKDFDFAIYILEQRNEFWAAGILSEIYSGKYLPEHANNEKAEHWRQIKNERMHAFYEIKKEYYENRLQKSEWQKQHPNKLIETASIRGINRFYFSEDWLYKDVSFDNSFFDIKKSIQYLHILDDEYRSKPLLLRGIASALARAIPSEMDIKHESPIWETFSDLSMKYYNLELNNINFDSSLLLELELAELMLRFEKFDEKDLALLKARTDKLITEIYEKKIAWRQKVIELFNEKNWDEFPKTVKTLQDGKIDETYDYGAKILSSTVLNILGSDKIFIAADPTSLEPISRDNPFKDLDKANALIEKLLATNNAKFYSVLGMNLINANLPDSFLHTIGMIFLRKSAEMNHGYAKDRLKYYMRPLGEF